MAGKIKSRILEAATGRPIVAIIGRQNVGKSTLLNRLAGRRIAIIEDLPGTTRDRIFTAISWHDSEFTLIDTGGLETKPDSTISQGINEQIETAISEADVVLFLVDVRDGLTVTDREIAELLRRSGKPVLLVVNKADNAKFEAEAVEFYELGLDEPVVISAYHGRGTSYLLDKIKERLPKVSPIEPEPDGMKITIVGRPNVGKSMLLNSILGEERVIVDDTPGTTRDAVDTLLNHKGDNVLLIDTAGIRRRGRLEAGVEKYSVIRAVRAIERCDIALLVIDATEPFTAQDQHICGYIRQMIKGIVIIVNKWDLIENKDMAEWEKFIRSEIKFMPYAPIIYTSAKTGYGVKKVIPQAYRVYRERLKRFSTAEVNSTIREAVAAHNIPRKGNKRLKLFYATQAEVNPPTFVFFVNDSKLVHFSYQRYLENKLRQSFGFEGTPLRLVFKNRSES